jgi:hypothetical protein
MSQIIPHEDIVRLIVENITLTEEGPKPPRRKRRRGKERTEARQEAIEEEQNTPECIGLEQPELRGHRKPAGSYWEGDRSFAGPGPRRS